MANFIEFNIIIWVGLLFICQWTEPVASRLHGHDIQFDNYYEATRRPYYNPFGYGNCQKGKFRFDWMRQKSSFLCPGDVDDRQSAEWNDYNDETRILKGYFAEPGEFPSSVYLDLFNDTKGNYCGGVLLNEYLILTAAHCLNNNDQGFAYAGSIHRLKGQKRAIKRGCHPIEYTGTNQSTDWAVVELFDKFELSREVQPACVNLDFKVRRDIKCVAVGFGRTQENKTSPLLKATVMKQVEPYMNQPGLIWTTEVKGESESGGVCHGDSGGPLYCFENCSGPPRMLVTGILSFGRGQTLSCLTMNISASVNTVSWRKEIPLAIKLLMDNRGKATLRRPASPEGMDITALKMKSLKCNDYVRPK